MTFKAKMAPQSNRKLLTRASNGRGVDAGVSKRSSSGAVMRQKSMCWGLEGGESELQTERDSSASCCCTSAQKTGLC